MSLLLQAKFTNSSLLLGQTPLRLLDQSCQFLMVA
jgi:hypothetical protein